MASRICEYRSQHPTQRCEKLLTEPGRRHTHPSSTVLQRTDEHLFACCPRPSDFVSAYSCELEDSHSEVWRQALQYLFLLLSRCVLPAKLSEPDPLPACLFPRVSEPPLLPPFSKLLCGLRRLHSSRPHRYARSSAVILSARTTALLALKLLQEDKGV